ncbi:hypothetical protein SAMN04488556_3953 [Halostagnicola kamekurae]|uniref:Uncharacterized protein n=1 Tax=Halostagnicola kamekurae TaxID=619731 RepID=A0A1I6UN48_9EURY|nr:hypothetical protein SAMN04488556_3953 [Halostagnicola kamekurae]
MDTHERRLLIELNSRINQSLRLRVCNSTDCENTKNRHVFGMGTGRDDLGFTERW